MNRSLVWRFPAVELPRQEAKNRTDGARSRRKIKTKNFQSVRQGFACRNPWLTYTRCVHHCCILEIPDGGKGKCTGKTGSIPHRPQLCCTRHLGTHDGCNKHISTYSFCKFNAQADQNERCRSLEVRLRVQERRLSAEFVRWKEEADRADEMSEKIQAAESGRDGAVKRCEVRHRCTRSGKHMYIFPLGFLLCGHVYE